MTIPARLRTACGFYAFLFRLGAAALALMIVLMPFVTGLVEGPKLLAPDQRALIFRSEVDRFALDNGWTLPERAAAEAAIKAHIMGDRGAALWVTLSAIARFVVGIVVFVLTARLLAAVAEGTVFETASIRRLRLIGYLLLGSLLLEAVLGMSIRTLYGEGLQAWRAVPVPFRAPVELADFLDYLFLALVALTAAWVLEEGRRLRAEAEAFV